MNRFSVFLLSLALFFACTRNTQTASENSDQSEETPSVTESSKVMLGLEGLYLQGDFNKQIDSDLSDFDLEISGCPAWELAPESIFNILDEMEEVDRTSCYSLCYQLGCWYESEATDGTKNYLLSIYAGAYLTLSNESETRYFILRDTRDEFLAACDCCDDE